MGSILLIYALVGLIYGIKFCKKYNSVIESTPILVTILATLTVALIWPILAIDASVSVNIEEAEELKDGD